MIQQVLTEQLPCALESGGKAANRPTEVPAFVELPSQSWRQMIINKPHSKLGGYWCCGERKERRQSKGGAVRWARATVWSGVVREGFLEKVPFE